MFEVNHANKKINCYIAVVLNNKKEKTCLSILLLNAGLLYIYNGIRNR